MAATPTRILVVDDNMEHVRILAVQLGRAGFEVLSAADPIQAKNLLQTTPVDLICLDLMMPAGGGVDVLRFLRRSTRHVLIPVVVLSGTTKPELVREVHELGIAAFVTKPWEADHLIRVVCEALPEGKRPPATGGAAP